MGNMSFAVSVRLKNAPSIFQRAIVMSCLCGRRDHFLQKTKRTK